MSDRSNYLWKATLATATVASMSVVNISGVLAQTPQASATSEATHTEEIEDVPAPAEELDPLPGTSIDPAAVENIETIEEPSTEPTPASEPPTLEETNVPTSEPTPEVTPDAGFPEPSVAPEPSPTSDSEPTNEPQPANEPQPSENTEPSEPSEVPAEVSPVPQPSAVSEPSPTAKPQPSESPLPDPAPTAEPTSSPTSHNTEEPTPHPSIPQSFPVEPNNHLPEEEVTVAPSPDNESAIDHAAAETETETTEQPTDSESVEEVPNTSAPTTQPSTTENQFSGSRPSTPAVNPTSSDGRQTGVLAPSEQQPPSAAHGSSSVAFEQPAPQTTTAQQHTVPPRTQRGWSTLSAVAYPQAQPENRNSSEPLLARATRPDTHGTKSHPGSSSLIASGTGLFGVNREKGEPNLVAPIQQQPAEWVQGLFSTTAQDSHGSKDSVAAGVTGANSQEHSAGTPTTSEALTRGEKIIQGNAPAIFFTLLGLGTIVYVTRQFTRSQKG